MDAVSRTTPTRLLLPLDPLDPLVLLPDGAEEANAVYTQSEDDSLLKSIKDNFSFTHAYMDKHAPTTQLGARITALMKDIVTSACIGSTAPNLLALVHRAIRICSRVFQDPTLLLDNVRPEHVDMPKAMLQAGNALLNVLFITRTDWADALVLVPINSRNTTHLLYNAFCGLWLTKKPGAAASSLLVISPDSILTIWQPRIISTLIRRESGGSAETLLQFLGLLIRYNRIRIGTVSNLIGWIELLLEPFYGDPPIDVDQMLEFLLSETTLPLPDDVRTRTVHIRGTDAVAECSIYDSFWIQYATPCKRMLFFNNHEHHVVVWWLLQAGARPYAAPEHAEFPELFDGLLELGRSAYLLHQELHQLCWLLAIWHLTQRRHVVVGSEFHPFLTLSRDLACKILHMHQNYVRAGFRDLVWLRHSRRLTLGAKRKADRL